MRKAAAAQGVSSINIQQAGAATARRQEPAVQTALGATGIKNVALEQVVALQALVGTARPVKHR